MQPSKPSFRRRLIDDGYNPAPYSGAVPKDGYRCEVASGKAENYRPTGVE